MTEVLLSYRLLECRLWYTRWRHEGGESPEEDATLDEMEQVWLKLSDEDRSLLRSEGPRCWPMDPSCWPAQLPGPGAFTPSPWTYEGFPSPEDTLLDTEAA